jgi:hypothetical protein
MEKGKRSRNKNGRLQNWYGEERKGKGLGRIANQSDPSCVKLF